MKTEAYRCTLDELISEMNYVIDNGVNEFIQPIKAIDQKTLNDFLVFCKNKNINVNYEEKYERSKDGFSSQYHEFKFMN